MVMEPQRSRRVRDSKTPTAGEEIYIQADILQAKQWEKVGLSPRTGWVVGVVAEPHERQDLEAAGASALRLDVLLKVAHRASDATDEVTVARLPLALAAGSAWWSCERPAGVAADLAALPPTDSDQDGS